MKYQTQGLPGLSKVHITVRELTSCWWDDMVKEIPDTTAEERNGQKRAWDSSDAEVYGKGHNSIYIEKNTTTQKIRKAWKAVAGARTGSHLKNSLSVPVTIKGSKPMKFFFCSNMPSFFVLFFCKTPRPKTWNTPRPQLWVHCLSSALRSVQFYASLWAKLTWSRFLSSFCLPPR